MEPSAPIEVAEEAPVLETARTELVEAVEGVASAEPSLTLEEAAARLSPKVLQALEDKFNGSLTQVRTPDEKDQLF